VAGVAEGGAVEEVEYWTVTELGELQAVLARVREAKEVAVDLETTGVDQMRAEIVGFSLCLKPREAFYVPVAHVAGRNLDRRAVLDVLGPILEDPAIAKVGQNIKYDAVVLRRAGIELQGISFDTMIASYLTNPSAREHNLDALSLAHLNHRMIPITDLIGKGQKQIGFEQVPVEAARDYACEDADVTLRLKEVLAPTVEDRSLTPLFRDVEIPLIHVLTDMELAGVAVDVEFLGEMSSQLNAEMARLVDEIYNLAGETFNVNSTQQLAGILFDKLGLTPKRKTKTGYSTDQSVLEQLAFEHPLPKVLLDYRELMKLQSTYVDALPKLVHPETGRIHASINQAVAATGRLSMSDPNLQNIPVRTELGRQIRKAFVPGEPGWVLMSADYSQIELRIMAHLAEDRTLTEAFESGEDVHRHTASLIFGLAPEYVTDEMRDRAKTVNFGVMYGMGAFGLSSRLGISLQEAREFIDSYFATYPGVKAFIDRTIAEAREQGFVTTILGRRRYLPEIASTKSRMREFAERTAVNTPVQGSASDMIKVAMIQIARRIREQDLRTKMILQVHDELVFEAPEAEVEDVRVLAVAEMKGALDMSVPIDVEVGVGQSWLEAH
jgi:DNA polymerase-1